MGVHTYLLGYIETDYWGAKNENKQRYKEGPTGIYFLKIKNGKRGSVSLVWLSISLPIYGIGTPFNMLTTHFGHRLTFLVYFSLVFSVGSQSLVGFRHSLCSLWMCSLAYLLASLGGWCLCRAVHWGPTWASNLLTISLTLCDLGAHF